ncbi:16S rRNA (cytidine1402-2'-O)-methyltransferase [Sporobacter termitidis DSM 10068]|uniref:Ribosomal RNA small subunit methyltransferase I n=1 Tax=Sporobacter termitidis DSM 10068 TaxID=1123282 RepID=A0A1M5YWM6_9FIRM|nr:16S rRNA (cytidine(1402)-2'-O)-methyltransferase [Sporobacter termitidis]SHI15943.1 16S rRNA (cytidine1402-2'-O)-methyltransferase [Sporobacter termitidis DSM 10068]
MSGTLYLVATPIGNLGDITRRAADVLAGTDFVAAEDTRVTLKLLNHLGLKKPLVSYYAHNQTESGARIVERILSGESCALVTDAGMPAISDPGEELVRLCADSGVTVTAIPGACAAVTALALSALPTGRFTFEGFLSTAKKSRFEHLRSLKDEKRTMIFYEAPHKLLPTLRDMLETFGDRRISISREMTKIHEETLRLTLQSAVAHFEATPPRGEFVLVIEGAPASDSARATLEDALDAVRGYRRDGLSLKDAVKKSAAEIGFPKNTLYEAALRDD